MAQITVRDVTKTYTVGSQSLHAVKQIALSIEKGDFISIVGHSGSGKTTLLSLIGGITNPSTGTIFFENRDMSAFSTDQLSEYRSESVGFMFQFASLLPMLTVKENLLLPTVFSGKKRTPGELDARAVDLLRSVGLADKINSYPSQLSGGQQRRVAIARAFINDPAVILADEPTGDLDEDTEAEMMLFFQAMNRKGVTFVMVTHNSDLAKQALRRISMHNGTAQEL